MLNFYDYHNEYLYNHLKYQYPISRLCTIRSGNTHIDYSNILHIIKKNPRYAYWYAKLYRKGRWVEAEPYIMKDTMYASAYSWFFMNERWREAEPIIKKNPYEWEAYCHRLNIPLVKI